MRLCTFTALALVAALGIAPTRAQSNPFLGAWNLTSDPPENYVYWLEVKEEAGLELALGDVVATVDLIERDQQGRIRYHYTLIDFVAEAASLDLHPGTDAADARWFGLAEIEALDLWSETVRVIKLAAERRPCR